MDSPLLVNSSTTIEIQEIPKTDPVTSSTKPEISLRYSTGKFFVRIAVILAISAVCIATNHLASNSFEVSIVNGAANTPIGRRFHIMFVSNGKISQFVYNSNRIIEQILYPTGSKKPINHIRIHLSDQNFTDMVPAQTELKSGEFSVVLSPGFLSSSNPTNALQTVLHRAMARVRIHNGPEEVVSAMVDYLTREAITTETSFVDTRIDSSCWSGGFMRYCESRDNGFVSRLNLQLANRSGLGLLNRSMCEDYKASLNA